MVLVESFWEASAIFLCFIVPFRLAYQFSGPPPSCFIPLPTKISLSSQPNSSSHRSKCPPKKEKKVICVAAGSLCRIHPSKPSSANFGSLLKPFESTKSHFSCDPLLGSKSSPVFYGLLGVHLGTYWMVTFKRSLSFLWASWNFLETFFSARRGALEAHLSIGPPRLKTLSGPDEWSAVPRSLRDHPSASLHVVPVADFRAGTI